jgi:chromosome segregation ATPase
MPSDNLWDDNRRLWNENQGLKTANDDLIRVNARLGADLEEEKRNAYDCHTRFVHRCRAIEDLEDQIRALKNEMGSETNRLSKMLESQVTENRRLTFDNQRLLVEVDELKKAKASDLEQSKVKLAELTIYSREMKGVKDAACAEMLLVKEAANAKMLQVKETADAKMLQVKEAADARTAEADAQNELQQVQAKLAKVHQSAKNLAELKQILSGRVKSVAAQNNVLRQEVLKKRPLEDGAPSPHAKAVAVARPVNQGALIETNTDLEAKNSELAKANAHLEAKNGKLAKAKAGLVTENEVLKSYNGNLEEQLAKEIGKKKELEEQLAKEIAKKKEKELEKRLAAGVSRNKGLEKRLAEIHRLSE